MAKIDGADPTLFMNPSAYSGLKGEKGVKTSRGRSLQKNEKTGFSSIFDNLFLGPVQSLPVSEESVDRLMDDVRDAGDKLMNRPLPEEIIRYKQAVRNFINYVVQNNFSLSREEGVPNFLKPGFKGQRGTPEAMRGYGYTKIEVIDKKLEDLAAMLLANQGHHLELVSRLEEIKGLLIDLME